MSEAISTKNVDLVTEMTDTWYGWRDNAVDPEEAVTTAVETGRRRVRRLRS